MTTQRTMPLFRRLATAFAVSVLMLGVLAPPRAFGQDGEPATVADDSTEDAQPTKKASTITGRVISTDGAAIVGATVRVTAPGDNAAASGRTIRTDFEGKFVAEDLSPSAYRVTVQAPGYVAADVDPPGQPPRYYWPGNSVVLTLTKGGVITGTVTHIANGQGIVALPVNLISAEQNGRPTSQSFDPAMTDDRGVYRIFGIPKGTYYVVAGGRSVGFSGFNQGLPYESEVRTYYPSATVDTAVPITVNPGDEITSIDIQYRGTKGYAISGELSSPVVESTAAVSVVLYRASDGALESSAFVIGSGDGSKFGLYGVADGQYELVAQSFGARSLQASSEPIPVTVRGSDVTGLRVALKPLAKVTGTIRLEKLKPEERPETYKPDGDWSLGEALVHIRRDEPNDTRRSIPFVDTGDKTQPPGESGVFSFDGLRPGVYRLATTLPSEDWFLRSIDQRMEGKKAPAKDLSGPLTLAAGATLGDVVVTVAEGAATVAGVVTPQQEGKPLPANVRVFLVPAEANAADDALRFFELFAEKGGAFQATHVAPGKYYVFAQVVDSTASRPLIWDKAMRAKIRTAATAAKQELTLGVCQRERGVTVRLGAAAVK